MKGQKYRLLDPFGKQLTCNLPDVTVNKIYFNLLHTGVHKCHLLLSLWKNIQSIGKCSGMEKHTEHCSVTQKLVQTSSSATVKMKMVVKIPF